MQTLTLKTTTHPDPVELHFLTNAKTVAEVYDIDTARLALGDAERLIHEQAERIKQLESLALTDELTGLTNRRGFRLALQRELAAAQRDPAANGMVVMVDLDGFKAINDAFGHSVGDDYLQNVAYALLQGVRPTDIVARIGGDEFAVLFTRLDENAGIPRIAAFEKSFNSRKMQLDAHSLPLKASFGAAVYRGTDTTEAVIAAADLKLYARKAQRKNIRAQKNMGEMRTVTGA